jgi:isopentenyl-diphosphate delta-isomerase
MSNINSQPVEQNQLPSRKADHIRINLEQNVQSGITNGLEKWRFMHEALPELDLNALDTSIRLFGKTVRTPLFVSSMTGGTEQARAINRNLAQAAQEAGMAMGLGSMRAAIAHPELERTFQVRDVAPDILLFANVGAVQLNYGFSTAHFQRALDMVQADALILHLNPLQEALQPEGDFNLAGLLPKIEQLAKAIPAPIIAKEVGWGISPRAAKDLANAGVAAIDVAGAGGTSWSQVEMYRAANPIQRNIAAAFADWGIPTADSIGYARRAAPHLPVFASGGLQTGVDGAKCIALGATLFGLARPLLKAATQSAGAVLDEVAVINGQLRAAMLCAGAADLAALQRTEMLRV